MNLEEMRADIIKDFSPAWELNDKAHRIEHFDNVFKCGMHINETLSLGYHPSLILLTAFFHDMFSWSRFNHHQLSSEWIKTTDYHHIASQPPEARALIAIGCMEHRASRTEPFSCEFGELMSSADREMPGDALAMVQRAIYFRMARGMTCEEAVGPAIQHIKEKFGHGGYARYPTMYQKVFSDELIAQRQMIAAL
jgi:hypothetical protein